MPGISSAFTQNGGPMCRTLFRAPDAVLIYADGGAGHPAIPAITKFRWPGAKGGGWVVTITASKFREKRWTKITGMDWRLLRAPILWKTIGSTRNT